MHLEVNRDYFEKRCEDVISNVKENYKRVLSDRMYRYLYAKYTTRKNFKIVEPTPEKMLAADDNDMKEAREEVEASLQAYGYQGEHWLEFAETILKKLKHHNGTTVVLTEEKEQLLLDIWKDKVPKNVLESSGSSWFDGEKYK